MNQCQRAGEKLLACGVQGKKILYDAGYISPEIGGFSKKGLKPNYGWIEKVQLEYPIGVGFITSGGTRISVMTDSSFDVSAFSSIHISYYYSTAYHDSGQYHFWRCLAIGNGYIADSSSLSDIFQSSFREEIIDEFKHTDTREWVVNLNDVAQSGVDLSNVFLLLGIKQNINIPSTYMYFPKIWLE